MWRFLDQYLVVYTTILATALMVSLPAKAAEASLDTSSKATLAQTELPQQSHRYSSKGNGNAIAQVNHIQQLRDVSPDDWAYEALRNLVERYGCIEGYRDPTYRGNRALTRYKFAVGLNACMHQIEHLIANDRDKVRTEDLQILQRLVRESQALSLPETLVRALNHESGHFFRNNSIRSQAELIFGFGDLGQASFPEKEIARDAELVEILYKDSLEQQVSSDPVLRTRDLDNPFDSSLLNNPSYLRNAPPE